MIKSITFSSDSKLVTSRSHDNIIKIWNVVINKKMQTLKDNNNSVNSRDEDGAVSLAKIGDHTTLIILIKIKKNKEKQYKIAH